MYYCTLPKQQSMGILELPKSLSFTLKNISPKFGICSYIVYKLVYRYAYQYAYQYGHHHDYACDYAQWYVYWYVYDYNTKMPCPSLATPLVSIILPEVPNVQLILNEWVVNHSYPSLKELHQYEVNNDHVTRTKFPIPNITSILPSTSPDILVASSSDTLVASSSDILVASSPDTLVAFSSDTLVAFSSDTLVAFSSDSDKTSSVSPVSSSLGSASTDSVCVNSSKYPLSSILIPIVQQLHVEKELPCKYCDLFTECPHRSYVSKKIPVKEKCIISGISIFVDPLDFGTFSND
jgi:hypothetical protein